jgi:hypothetical protein
MNQPTVSNKSRKLIDKLRLLSRSHADREARRIVRDARRLAERCRAFASHHSAGCACVWCGQDEAQEAKEGIAVVGKVIRAMLPDIEPGIVGEELVELLEEHYARKNSGASGKQVDCEEVGEAGQETVHQFAR